MLPFQNEWSVTALFSKWLHVIIPQSLNTAAESLLSYSHQQIWILSFKTIETYTEGLYRPHKKVVFQFVIFCGKVWQIVWTLAANSAKISQFSQQPEMMTTQKGKWAICSSGWLWNYWEQEGVFYIIFYLAS